MINCPNCNKELADNTVHCGYCGQEVKTTSDKKTMFGMAALSSDQLKKALEEARSAQQAGADQARPKIPAPGDLKPAAPTANDDDISLAKTEMLDLSDEQREVLANTRPAASTSNADPFAADEPTANLPAAEAPTLMSSPGEPLFGNYGDDAAPGFGDSIGDTGPTEPTTAPSFGDSPSVGDTPSFGDSPAFGQTPTFRDAPQAGEQTQPAPQNHFGPSQGLNAPAAQPGAADLNVEPEKSKKGLYIILGLVVLLFGGGCFLSLAWWGYSTFVAG